jgi:hypothetical protein
MSQAEAEAEVSRLSQLNAGKGYVYLYCTSHLIERRCFQSPGPEQSKPHAPFLTGLPESR